jgi:hypothetical protein
VHILSYPTTCLRFRPVTGAYKTRNVLLAANADGTVQHWHVTSGKVRDRKKKKKKNTSKIP